jgi:electron transfer flavoprotein beta subunit
MKILVPLKQIQDPAGLMVNRKAGKVFINREEYMINPADKRALDAALAIQDSGDAAVTVASVGPARAADALRQARALGADRAIHLLADSADEAIAARALAALCNSPTLGGFDLILTGDSALDSGETVGPRLAESLNLAFLGNAVECSLEGNVIRVVKAHGKEFHAYEADLPAVVTVSRNAAVAARYAHGGNIIATYRDSEAVETMTLADLGLSEADLQPALAERGQSFPPEREFGKQVTLEDVAGVLKSRD